MGELELLETILNRLDLIYTLLLVGFGAVAGGFVIYLIYRFVISFF